MSPVGTQRSFHLIIEKHPDGFVAWPLGLRGVVVGQGDTEAAAITDAISAIRFHLETFGADALPADDVEVEDVFVWPLRLAV